MSLTKSTKRPNGVYLLISALAIGWMIGLSVSPVVNIIISSVITLLVAVVSLLSGIKERQTDESTKATPLHQISNINILPITLFTVGLAISSSLGIFARTNEFLGETHNHKMKRISIDSALKNNEAEDIIHYGALFAVSYDDRKSLQGLRGDDLKRQLNFVTNGKITSLIEKCENDSCLETIKLLLCTTSK